MDTQTIILIVLVVLLVGVLIIMPIFTNKKNKKTMDDMHGALKPGVKVMTIGGIVGTVLAVSETSPVDKEIVIETGTGKNKSTITLDIKGLYQILTPPAASAEFASGQAVVPVASPEKQELRPEVFAEPEKDFNNVAASAEPEDTKAAQNAGGGDKTSSAAPKAKPASSANKPNTAKKPTSAKK